MRFSSHTSTTTTVPITLHQVTPNMSHLKKVFTTLVSKLPHNHNQKVGPMMVKNNSTSYIKVVPKNTPALKKDNDMNRDLRNYYSQQQQSSRKRQLEDVYNKKVELERETRHKTVKQYQQGKTTEKEKTCHHHWKEHSTMSINNNKSAQQPKWINTHGYIRDTRSNSDYLRKLALTNSSSSKMTKEKPYLKKRSDEFVWGKPSPLRNTC